MKEVVVKHKLIDSKQYTIIQWKISFVTEREKEVVNKHELMGSKQYTNIPMGDLLFNRKGITLSLY